MLILLGLLACGADPTIIDGSVADNTLGEPLTAMWGGPFIVFVKDQVDCRDLDFTRRTYDQGNAPVDFDIVAQQMSKPIGNMGGGPKFGPVWGILGRFCFVCKSSNSSDEGFTTRLNAHSSFANLSNNNNYDGVRVDCVASGYNQYDQLKIKVRKGKLHLMGLDQIILSFYY